MALETYKQKRNFKKTPEPTGGKPTDKKLHFVVQKHQATSLHYDFRIELRGILKSWAVPKGPSMSAAEKHLALLVEDHPWDYKYFEGVIPSGYGKGTVMIWDEGTYETTAIKEKDKKAQEHSITSQFWKGEIKLTLHGHKLKGGFVLTKAKEKGDNAWYVQKTKDKYATKKEVTKKDKSIVSKKTLAQIAENPEKLWKGGKEEKAAGAPEETDDAEHVTIDIKALIKKGKKAVRPSTVNPMLCTKYDIPFDSEDYLFELKLDGYRIISHIKKGKVKLQSRNNQDYTSRYPAVVDGFKNFAHDAVIDGEVVAFNKDNKPDFSAIQNYRPGEPLLYYVFDIIWLDGYDISQLSLLERKSILSQILPVNETVLYLDHVEERGKDFYEAVKKQELEGIVAKRKDSEYVQDERGRSWLKIAIEVFVEYVIIGYTESEHGRPFSRIMFGEYRDGKLYYVYHTGGGISDKLLYSTFNRLKKLEVKKKPVENNPKEETPIHWVKPILVGQFKEKKLEKTKSGSKRHPVIFLGIREDKKPSEINTEDEAVEEKPQEEIIVSTKYTVKNNKRGKNKFNEIEVWKSIHKEEEIEKKEIIEVEGKTITIINPEKEYWQGITKVHVLLYYQSIAEFILPYLKDRPLGLNIITTWAGDEKNPFIRNMQGYYPPWVKIFTSDRKVKIKGKSEDIDWVVCNDLATLLYMVNLGALDLHPWAATTKAPNNPDYLVIDLDPPEREDQREKSERKAYEAKKEKDFRNLITTAQAVKKTMDKYDLTTFIKTSGKRGLHIFIPCEKISYDDTRSLAEKINTEIHELVPKISTIEIDREHPERKEKIYIDSSQNDYSDRVAVAYSVRAYNVPTVSTPLDWEEVNEKLDRKAFRINNILQRIEQKGDLFNGLFDKKIKTNNSKILKRFIQA